MQKKIIFIFIAFFSCTYSYAQDSIYNCNAHKYISQYCTLAICEQKRSGIPACITLAQGIVETEAGTSELLTKANNHFGIKCKNGWTGPTFTHTDDSPNECFKMYQCAEESYKDHSDHLKRNPRYSPLFSIPVTDYAEWAKCLRKCGYATDPQYANRLIKAIEDYKLQEYTFAALNNTTFDTSTTISLSSFEKKRDTAIVLKDHIPVPAPTVKVVNDNKTASDTIQKSVTETAHKVIDTVAENKNHKVIGIENNAIATTKIIVDDTLRPRSQKTIPLPYVTTEAIYDTGRLFTVSGLKAFYTYKNESLLPYAMKYNIRYAHLLEINDLTDAPLPCDMIIYLENKKTEGIHPKHAVKENENLLQIAQTECIQLKKLMVFNMLDAGEEPAVGVILELQQQTTHKPLLRTIAPDPIQDQSLSPAANNREVANLIPPTNTPEKSVIANSHIDTNVIANNNDISMAKVSNMSHSPVDSIAMKLKKPIVLQKKDNKTEDTSHADLSALKTDLDQLVYARDNKPAHVKKQRIDYSKKEENEPNATISSNEKYYKVKKGDTISSIARQNHISVKKLKELNNIDPDKLSLGQTIKLQE